MRRSAGILLYRKLDAKLEVFLVHPGGPFWQNKDLGAWTIPKGEVENGDEIQATALRELAEETGISVQEENLSSLGMVKQKGGKEVYAFAAHWPHSIESHQCNTFSIEWPPRSGKMQEFPEVDRAEFFPLEVAMEKINPAQRAFLDRLVEDFAKP